MMNYLELCGKRQTNAWMVRAALEVSTEPVLQAKWLNNLGAMLSRMGDRPGALKATEEALQIHRKLAENDPEAFLPDVAMTLNNLGNRLSDTGDRPGALKATQEAPQIRRKLAEKHPEAFLPDVVATLQNLGIILSAMGQMSDADDRLRESVIIARRAADLTGAWRIFSWKTGGTRNRSHFWRKHPLCWDPLLKGIAPRLST